MNPKVLYIHYSNMYIHGTYIHTLVHTWNMICTNIVHRLMYLIISLYPAFCVQDTILVIPPYPYCIEED